MQGKVIKCGRKGYYVQIFSPTDVRVRDDNASFRGNGKVLADMRSYEDALAFIKADAGGGAMTIRDY